MILESNQNHATAKDTEVVNALPASMGMGGGYVPMLVESYGLITKGNGDVILSTEKHMSLSTGGGQAGQGYPCVLEPIGADLFNQTTTGTVSMTMSNRATDAHHIPCVIEPIAFRDDITIKIDVNGVGYTLSDRDYKGVQCVVTKDAESNRNT